jgi:hypothetical protein
MAKTSGEITYAYDYDVDKILTTQYNCIVRAKDTGFNTATTSLIIKICTFSIKNHDLTGKKQ